MTIKQLRKITGLSQAAFGKKYGISTNTVARWERGEHTPPVYVTALLERVILELDFKGCENENLSFYEKQLICNTYPTLQMVIE